LIRVKSGVSTIRLGNLAPQLPGTLATAITHMEGDDLARPDIHGQPYPLLVGLLLHKAGHLVGFNLQALDDDVGISRDRLHIQMVWQVLKTGDDKAQEPLESDAHRATDAAKRQALQQ